MTRPRCPILDDEGGPDMNSVPIPTRRFRRPNMDRLEPDALLSSQWFGDRKPPLDPERLLMLAVLEDAVRDATLVANDPRARALRQEALDWIASPARQWLFSFENICDCLGLDADYLRRGLRELRTRHIATVRIRGPVTSRAGVGEAQRAGGKATPYCPSWQG